MYAFLADRGVDYQINLAVGYGIEYVRTTLIELFNLCDRQSGIGDKVIGSACCENLEAIVYEASCDIDNLLLILAVNRDEDCSLKRKLGGYAFLRFVEGFTIVG